MIEPRHIQQAIERALQALILATEKPSQKGDNIGGGGSITPPLPLPVGIISAKRELRDILLLWTDLVSDGMDVVANCDPTESSMLAWLGGSERAGFLAAHDAGMDFLEELTLVTKAIEGAYLPRFGRKYLGHHGGGDVYVKEGQTEVTLADGTVERIETIRAFNANAMLMQEGTATEVAGIIKSYFGHTITPKQIKDTARYDKKKEAGIKLEHVRIDNGAYVYSVGDVLDRMVKKEISPKT